MANSKESKARREGRIPNVMVLRWGHRPFRDSRLTTHVVLTSRALGASGTILSDVSDEKIRETIEKVSRNWGGRFSFIMGIPWKRAVRNWKANSGIVVHLTAYGENIETSDVLRRIKRTSKDLMILVGSQKVPKDFFDPEVSDFNVAIGNQPHSECASLAVFLDRFFGGQELKKPFSKAKIRIIPSARRKRITESHGGTC